MKHQQRWTARQSQDETAWGICLETTERKPVWIIYPTTELDSQDAALIMASHNAAIEKLGRDNQIQVNSITNTRLEAIIELVVGAEVVQLHLREGRQLAMQMLEVIEAAQSDALLCRFIRDYVYHGATTQDANHAIGHMLTMFREFRKSLNEPTIEVEGQKDA